MKLGNPVREIRTIKRLLTGAEAEAQRMGEILPGAEHLLLSALALPDGSARRAFGRLGADPDRLREAIGAQHSQALRGIGIEPVEALEAMPAPDPTGPMRSQASLQGTFQAAVALAKATRPSRLVGAHVVVAVAEMEHGTAARSLSGMGIDCGALAAAAARDELGTEDG